jgi:hypothetical protein
MDMKLIELGEASKQTRDYSGFFMWDTATFDFKKRPPFA